MNLHDKAVKIEAVVLDIDGVLTNGLLGYGEKDEIKFFHVRDGHGIKLAMRAGLKIGILSGRTAEANRRRAEELGFDFIYEGEKNKREAFGKLLDEQNLNAEACLYIGDDVVDIPVLRRAGLAATVADAPEDLDPHCDIRAKLPGGQGAVREILEWLLKEQNKWNDLMQRYLS